MTEERQIQSQECLEQHKMLKEGFDNLLKNCRKMQAFLFGSADSKPGELSLVDKVNIMFQMMNENRTFFKTMIASSIIAVIGWIFGICYFICEIRVAIESINDCKAEIQQIKQDGQDFNKRLIILETKTGVK